MLRFFRQALVIAAKDLTLELRARERIASMLTFAVLVAVVFSFALDPTLPARGVAGAMIWVTLIFAGLLGVGRAFTLEREQEALTGLLLTPIDRGALYLGKLLANLALLLVTAALVLGVFALFFSLPIGRAFGGIAGIVVLASVGFMTLGTLIGAMAASTKLGETLIPVLLLPLLIPVIVFAASATQRLLIGRPAGEVAGSMKMLLAFDVVFLVVCTLVFPSVVEE